MNLIVQQVRSNLGVFFFRKQTSALLLLILQNHKAYPETKERIVKIFETWKGRASEKELEEILGGKSAKKLRDLVDKSDDELSSNEVDNLRKLFKESVTFD